MDHGSRNARTDQQLPVDFVISIARHDDARRVLVLEQFRRPQRSFMRAAAQNDDHIRLHPAIVQGQNVLGKEIGNGDQCRA